MFIGYLFCIAIGVGIGIIVELVLWLLKVIRKKKKQS